MANKQIKQIRLSGETYDIALDNVDKVDGLVETLNSFTSIESFPNNEGEIKTKYRLSLKDFTSESTASTRYYKLTTLPINNTTNYASLVITGRIGGWSSDTIALINALVWNKGTPGMSVLNIASDNVTALTNIWRNCDLELYVNSSTSNATATASLYLKCYGYFAFDLDLELLQSTATIDYTGSYTTTIPSGVLAAKLSTSDNKVDLVKGKLLVNGSSTLTCSWNSATGVLTLNESSFKE